MLSTTNVLARSGMALNFATADRSAASTPSSLAPTRPQSNGVLLAASGFPCATERTGRSQVDLAAGQARALPGRE